MLKVALTIGVLTLASPAVAGDHLVPSQRFAMIPSKSDGSDDYLLTHIFKDAFADDVVVRMFASINPGFVHAVAILKRDNRYSALVLHDEARPGVRSPRFLRLTSLANWKRYYRVARRECDLSPALGSRVVEDWRAAILRAHYDSPIKGVVVVQGDEDGYDFSTMGASGWVSGETWSPDPDSEAGLLVSTSKLIERLCGGEAISAELETTLGRLEEAVRP
jgi:hypothetical protein